MGLKKYEIITVGSVKRVRALRSWVVQGRQVNVGDVGGAVFDERTLSQDGDAWIFSGRLDNPLVRVGGDSVVSIGEVAAPRFPHLNIFGTSSIDANFNVSFGIGNLSSARPLTPAMMEAGAYGGNAGQPLSKGVATDQIRVKTRMFTGGGAWAVPAPSAGYLIRVIVTDTEGIVIYNSGNTSTAVNVSAGAHAYGYIVVMKSPLSAIVPADVTAAALTFQDYAEATINVVDSHITLTGTGSGGYVMISASGKYQGNVTNIEGSTVQVNRTSGNQILNLFCDLINTTATVNMAASDVTVYGVHRNVKNLVWGATNWSHVPFFRTCIQAYDCDNMVINPTIFPGLAADAQTANMPFIFQGCNVPGGRFYHHVKIANTYKNIDFALAQADLGKMTPGGPLVSSEVEGMYRLFRPDVRVLGGLVESYESVKILTSVAVQNSYGTTIYKDAYFNGMFDFAGTNVFGNKVRSHPLAQVLNVAPRAVQGTFNTIVVGETITGVTANANRVCVPLPFRVNGSKGLTINCPTGIEGAIICTDINGVIKGLTTLASGESGVPAAQLVNTNAYLFFAKTGGGAITPEDLVGVTVTVYNGCKIVNTGATAVNMKGSIRVEDNATLVNASVTGSGYFGGNSVVYYNPTVWASLDFNGTVYMKDDAVFAPSALTGANALVRMEGKAKFTGSVDAASTNLSFIMRDNAIIEGKANTRSGVVMSGNSKVTAAGQITAASRGVLVMEENASIEANTTVIGAITLSGNYKGNVVKTWTGKRTITDVNAPEYDNNVKTQYDF